VRTSLRAVRVLAVCAAAGLVALLVAAAPSGAVAHRDAGATHRVQVRVGMRGQRFTPARIVATAGDSIRFELESGGPHNVAFYSDSIPAGALATLARNLGTEPRYLFTPDMLLSPGETFVLSLAGLPPGTYPFYCAPHLGGGMRGELVIRAREP
jgi:plastocyanin